MTQPKPDIFLRNPVNALISYHYFSRHDVSQLASWGLRLIGDSGAYSALSQGAPIDIDAFAAWVKQWRDSFSWVASLDVIGDKDASWTNFRYLRDKYELDVVPTIHYGCDPSEMDRYVAEGIDFIGLGGMVSRKSEVSRLLRWTLNCFRYAQENHPQVRFHGWGTTHKDLIYNLPWFSVDSSGFSSSYRYGRLQLFDPNTCKSIAVALDGKEIFQHADLLMNEYGVNPSDVSVSTKETRRDVTRLSVAVVQRQEDYLRKRHKVSAPTYGLNPRFEQAAPNVHVVMNAPKAQPSLSLSPDDKGTRLYSAIDPWIGLQHITPPGTPYLDKADDAPRIHIASSPVWPFEMSKPNDVTGPHLHISDSEIINLRNLNAEEKQDEPRIHIAVGAPLYLQELDNDIKNSPTKGDKAE